MDYPKTKTGKICLTKCYPPNVLYIHPVTLESFGDNTKSTCAILPFYIDGVFYETDECYLSNINSKKDDKLINIINPDFKFGSKEFLYLVYNIEEYSQFINWLNNNNNQKITTKKRVINSFFDFNFKSIKLIDDILIENLIDIFKYSYLNDFFKHINPYLEIKDSNIILIKKPSNTQRNNHIERINYINEKFINVNEIKKFMIKYIDNYNNEIINIEIIKNNYIDYIINKIKIS